MPADRNDSEILAFVRASKAETHSATAVEIAMQFGSERAWSPELVADVTNETNRPHMGASRCYKDRADIMAFIADRAGLKTVEEIAVQGAAKFGQGRFPAKSTVHRLLTPILAEIRRKARQPGSGGGTTI